MDYCFFTKINFEHREVESEDTMPILVAYDDAKECFWALDVGHKGANPEGVKWCCDTLEDSGYHGTDVTVKSDQEPSIVALRRGIALNRTGNTVPINSPVRCSKSNGRMENCVKRFQGHMRVLKHFFESKVQRELPPECAMFSWLVTWTAESLNKFKVGYDGLTAYERITKHKCGHENFGFGESVIWQMTPDKTDRNKLDSNFRDGVFLGVVWRISVSVRGELCLHENAKAPLMGTFFSKI